LARYEEFQRIFMMSEPEALSLNAQAALGVVRPPRRTQFELLVRHFLERFFNHETASPHGDAKARLILIAVATGIPGFLVALYLWPVYHPFIGWPPGRPLNADPPPYWLQVNHHFFFVLYSFVAMGIITVFEWDLFFPDLLDVFVLTTLPIQDGRLFLARVAAIGVFIVGFLLLKECCLHYLARQCFAALHCHYRGWPSLCCSCCFCCFRFCQARFLSSCARVAAG
jgi:hypothetical protein